MFPVVRKCSRDDAAAVARAEAERREWQWSEPEKVLPGFLSYAVFPAGYSGGRWAGPVVIVSSISGQVKSAGIARR